MRPCFIPRPIPMAASHSLSRDKEWAENAPLLRRPKGLLDEPARSRVGREGTSLYPGPEFSIQENSPGSVGLVSAPQKGVARGDEEKNLFSTSSNPVLARASIASFLPCDRRRSSWTMTVVRQDRSPVGRAPSNKAREAQRL